MALTNETLLEIDFEYDTSPGAGEHGQGLIRYRITNAGNGEELDRREWSIQEGGRNSTTRFNSFGWLNEPGSDRTGERWEGFFDDVQYGTELLLDTFVPRAGDANGDRSVDTADVVQILGAGKFETGQPATFEEGDFDGDGVFATSDIVAMLGEGKFETGPYRALQDPLTGSNEVVVSYNAADVQLKYVPEPSTVILFALGLIGVVGCNRYRWA